MLGLKEMFDMMDFVNERSFQNLYFSSRKSENEFQLFFLLPGLSEEDVEVTEKTVNGRKAVVVSLNIKNTDSPVMKHLYKATNGTEITVPVVNDVEVLGATLERGVLTVNLMINRNVRRISVTSGTSRKETLLQE